MLRKLQNKKVQKKIWITLLIFILPGFVIWGFSSSLKTMRQQDHQNYGKIFNQNISSEEYTEAMRAVKIQLQMQLGDKYLELEKTIDLKSMVFQRLVLLSEANKRKIKVNDSELTDYIQKDPSFYRKGIFDENLYEQVIKYSLRMQPRSYEEMTRQNLKLKKLIDSVTQELKITDEQIRQAYNKENEQLSVYYISAIPTDFAQGLNPSETEIKEYFDKNSIQFKKPLSFNLEYITLDSFTQIKDLNQRVEKKDDLKIIAKENNLILQETGLFGEIDPIPGIGWSGEISKYLNQLKTGELFGPLEIEKKFYLFRIKEKKEPYIPEFKDLKKEIIDMLIKTKSHDLAKAKINDCAKKLKNLSESNNSLASNFDKIAKEFNLKSASTSLFKFGSYIEGIGASDIFFNTAAKLINGTISEIIELPSGFYIIKLKDKPALDEKKFSEDKIKFGEKLLNEKKQEYLENFLKELTKKIVS